MKAMTIQVRAVDGPDALVPTELDRRDRARWAGCCSRRLGVMS
jgi:hypothetical protein